MFARFFAAAALAALAACREPSSGSPAGPAALSSIPSVPPRSSAKAHAEAPPPRTTDGAIAVENLGSQIAGAEKQAASGPAGADAQARLIDLLTDRGTFLGRIADLERAAELAEDLVRRSPKAPAALLARAGARTTMHRFADALADLERAKALGARPEELEDRRASILAATGDYDGALAIRRRQREERATTATLSAEASVLAEMGKTGDAAVLFADARRAYRNVSPFPIAWLEYEEGAMWERAGDLDRARELFRAAHARLPAYAHAAAHLAALEPPARGAAILRPILATSDDPEYAAALARILRAMPGRDPDAGSREGPAEAAELIEQARRRYEQLVAAHPLAFADHAGWFWLGAGGDTAKALSIARRNLDARGTPAAFELLIAAASDARDHAGACDAAERALALAYPTIALREAMVRAFSACGREDRAAQVKGALAEGAPR